MQHQIERVPIDEITGAPRNPKDHDIGAIMQSLVRFGFIAPAIRNETTGRIVAGHGRLEALEQLKRSGAQPPAGITVDDKGRWLMPVVGGVRFATDSEAEAYLIADNRLTMIGAWDDATLAEVLADLAGDGDLAGTGFDGDDLDRLLEDLSPADQPVVDDGEYSTPHAPRGLNSAGNRLVVGFGRFAAPVEAEIAIAAKGAVVAAFGENPAEALPRFCEWAVNKLAP